MKIINPTILLYALATSLGGCSEPVLSGQQISTMTEQEVGIYFCEAVKDNINLDSMKPMLEDSSYNSLIVKNEYGQLDEAKEILSKSDCHLVDFDTREYEEIKYYMFKFKSFGDKNTLKMSKQNNIYIAQFSL